jgi:hypothetical protein
MPRTFPSRYGQTVGGSLSSRKCDLSGSAAAAVGTPRTIEPLAGGKAYFSPCSRNSKSAGRLTLFSAPDMYSKPESTQRLRAFDTSDGEMERLSARALDCARGSFWIASLRRSAMSWPCMCSLQFNFQFGNWKLRRGFTIQGLTLNPSVSGRRIEAVKCLRSCWIVNISG